MLCKTSLIKLANVVIEGTYSLTKMEQRLLSVIILSLQNSINIRKTKEDEQAKNIVTLDFVEIKKILKLDETSGIISRLTVLFNRMSSKRVKFIDIEGEFICTSWFVALKISKNTERIHVEIPTKLLPYLVNLRR